MERQWIMKYATGESPRSFDLCAGTKCTQHTTSWPVSSAGSCRIRRAVLLLYAIFTSNHYPYACAHHSVVECRRVHVRTRVRLSLTSLSSYF